MKMTLYYAVSGTGQGRVFTSLPERDEHFKIWTGKSFGAITTTFMLFESEGMQVPNISWKDEPIELELSLEFKEK